ncbi:hypothetical protein ABVK25_001108 [Lepraria finkii]|uniref:Uncharacterized protein n=1 Tax=Lepraria finkii TaxID=1340010 RepID=A0ABR4BKZ0_9LECA
MESNPPKSITLISNNSPVENAKYTFHIIRLTSTELAHYPKLPQLADMINTAFTVAGLKNPGLYEAAERKRYGAPADLVDDIGPCGITFVTLATTEEQDDPEPIATTGYKPWSDTWKLAAKIDGNFTVTDFPKKDKILNDVPRFEIVAVAVDSRF